MECSNARTRKATREEVRSPYIACEPYQRREQPIIETDADQARIKRAIDERYSIGHCQGRSLKGTAEWDDVVKTITPLDRVPQRHAMPPMAPSIDNYGGMAR